MFRLFCILVACCTLEDFGAYAPKSPVPTVAMQPVRGDQEFKIPPQNKEEKTTDGTENTDGIEISTKFQSKNINFGVRV